MSTISLLVFAAAAALFAASCGGTRTVDRSNTMNTELETRLEAEIKKKKDSMDGNEFPMSAVTDFGWDRLFVFTPYTPFQIIAEKVGADASKLKNVDMDRREEINLLVFMNNGKIASFVEFPRRKGDFDKIARPDGFTREDALFKVTIEDRGEPWITVLEAR